MFSKISIELESFKENNFAAFSQEQKIHLNPKAMLSKESPFCILHSNGGNRKQMVICFHRRQKKEAFQSKLYPYSSPIKTKAANFPKKLKILSGTKELS